MPGTLVHLGLQGLAARAVCRGADLAWVYIGVVIPDIPWIVSRAAGWIAPAGMALDLRLYGAVQSSLLLSVILSGAAALFAATPGRAFGLMASASALHLLLDAIEIKWGAGPLVLAPFDWRTISFDLVRTDGAVSLALTMTAAIIVGAHWASATRGPPLFRRPPPGRAAAGLTLLCAWLGLPLLWMPAVEASGYQGVAVLRDRDARVGRSLVMDRAPLARPDGTVVAIALNGEPLRLDGDIPDSARKASIRGTFISPGRIRVDAFRVHHPWGREAQSMLGLGLVAAILGLRLR